MSISLRPFEDSLPMALMRAREAVMREFRPRLAIHGLTEQQWRVMRALEAHGKPMTTRELSDMTFLLSPSLSRITAKLAARGLITKEANPSDLRSSLLNISETGKTLISRMAPKSEEGYQAIEDSFGKDRLDQLHHLLQDLAATEVCIET